jgi:hypothetical protein
MMAPIHAKKAVKLAERWMRAKMLENFIEPKAMIVSASQAVERDPATGKIVTKKRPSLSVYLRDIVQNTDFRYTFRIPRPLDVDDARAIIMAVFASITAKAKSEAKKDAEKN